MAPSTRLAARPERRVDYRPVVPSNQVGSANNPVVLEDTPPPQVPALRRTRAKNDAASKPVRDAQGRFFIKSKSAAKAKPDRNKVTKTVAPPKKEKKEKKQARPDKIECVICASTKSTKRCFKAFHVKGICGHFENVCNTCVQKLVKTKISERQLAGAHLLCVFPGCEVRLDHAALRMVLPKAVFETWDMAITKHLLAGDPSYIVCLNSGCGAYFSIEDCGSDQKSEHAGKKSKDDSIKAACPNCEHALCLTCNRPWHLGTCNNAKQLEDEESEKTIRRMGAKACPKCGVNIEKRGGCDHMTCQRCRHNFCWECLGGFKGTADEHAETCSHRRPQIANDIANFADANLTVAQVHALIERARRDREAGRVPQPNLLLGPGVRVVDGAAVRAIPAPAALLPPAVLPGRE